MTVSPTARRYVHRKRPETLLLEAVVVFRHRVPEDDRMECQCLNRDGSRNTQRQRQCLGNEGSGAHGGKGSVLPSLAAGFDESVVQRVGAGPCPGCQRSVGPAVSEEDHEGRDHEGRHCFREK